MKTEQLKQMIREEIRKALNEAGPTVKDVQQKVMLSMENWLDSNIENEVGLELVDSFKDPNYGTFILLFKDNRTSTVTAHPAYKVTINIQSRTSGYTPRS